MIYWDHNAGTPLLPEVQALLRERLFLYGNASSVHQQGRRARARLEDARARVAASLGCEAKEVSFVASGSEANALALFGAYRARAREGRREIVTSSVEHPSIGSVLEQLRCEGALVHAVRPGVDGRVDPDALAAHLGESTAVCTLMAANNETGVLQPAEQLARLCRKRGIPFHTDAVQLPGRVPVKFHGLDADLLSLAGHKFGAPPGTAVLVARGEVSLRPLVPGHQEGGRKGGTVDVTGAEALALALELAQSRDVRTLQELRDAFEREVLRCVPTARVNGGGAPRLANTSNLRFEGADAEALLIALDLEGICVSTGAACASGSLKPSHVLLEMGLSREEARQSLRFSLGAETTKEDVKRVVSVLARAVG